MIKCDICNKKLNLEKDIVALPEIGQGCDRQLYIYGKVKGIEPAVKIGIEGLYDYEDENNGWEPIFEGVCLDCIYEIIKEIINNKTEIEWTRE